MLRTAALSVLATFSALVASSASAEQLRPVEAKGKTLTSDFGEVWNEQVWEDDGATLVLIPAGTYEIGTSDESLPGYGKAEGPATTVTVGSFYIDKFEITNEQYAKIAAIAGLPKPTDSAARAEAYKPEKPVSGIAWSAAMDYAKAVRRALPTEAEWEIAARGKAANLYPWGNGPKEGAVLGRGATASPEASGSVAVDLSPFGVHDMAGNVGEWTADAYDRDYYGKVAGQSNPLLTAGGSDARTVRGGNYYTKSDGRATLRAPGVPNQSREEVGFRTVFRLEKAPPTPTPTPTPIPVTPTPTADVRTEEMRAILAPLLSSNTYNVPSERVAFDNLTGTVPVINRSPFDARLAGVSLDDGSIYFLNTQVASGESTRITMPGDKVATVFAWAKTPLGERLVSLGQVNEAGAPLLMVEVNAFTPVLTDEEDEQGNRKTLESGDGVAGKQIYAGGYYPQWTEIVVYNSLPSPAEFVVGKPQKDGTSKERMRESLAPGETMLVKGLEAGGWRLEARYVGARDAVQSNAVNFNLDDKADLRLFRLGHSADGVMVRDLVNKSVPKIDIAQKDLLLPADLRSTYLPGGTEPDAGKSTKGAAKPARRAK